jgi:hypothetical protein
MQDATKFIHNTQSIVPVDEKCVSVQEIFRLQNMAELRLLKINT